MKKFLVFLVVIAVLGVLFSLILNYFSSGLNKESQEFADQIIPSISSSWDAEILIRHASPELLKKVPAYKIRDSFAAFSEKFGPLQKYRGSKGQVGVHIEKETRIITATYSAQADFRNRSAVIKIQMVRNNDKWQISAFHID